MRAVLVPLLVMLMLTTTLSGCLTDEQETVTFPEFSAVADDGQTYDNARMAENGAYMVLFSAEWCNSPCYNTMHNIWQAQANLPVLVMSTDPVENIGGVSLSDWHDSADAHDDEGNDTGVSLTSYAFMKGHEAGNALVIDTPGTLVFVNGDGEVTATHEGRIDSTQLILDYWNEAQGA